MARIPIVGILEAGGCEAAGTFDPMKQLRECWINVYPQPWGVQRPTSNPVNADQQIDELAHRIKGIRPLCRVHITAKFGFSIIAPNPHLVIRPTDAP